MDVFGQIVEKIIKEQEGIIGPIALEQAQKVPGLKIDWQKHEVKFEGSQKDVVEKLVEKYRDFFGQASVEVCKDAAKRFLPKIPQEQVPAMLR